MQQDNSSFMIPLHITQQHTKSLYPKISSVNHYVNHYAFQIPLYIYIDYTFIHRLECRKIPNDSRYPYAVTLPILLDHSLRLNPVAKDRHQNEVCWSLHSEAVTKPHEQDVI